jgi:hypothetical protein
VSYNVKGGRLQRYGRTEIFSSIDEIDSRCDIRVDAKFGQTVMILANARGRRAVEDAWPDVKWATDHYVSSIHSPDWLFTHIRVTRLPPYLEQKVPLAFASPDALGFAVALSLQRRCELGRVIFYSGEGTDLRLGKFGKIPKYDPSDDVALYAEYLSAGIPIDEPVSGSA